MSQKSVSDAQVSMAITATGVSQPLVGSSANRSVI